MLVSKRQQKILDELFILARDGERVSRASISAAIVYRNKIISYGFNQKKSHPLQNRFKKNPHAIFLHAEVDAIKNALKVLSEEELSKCTLMVVRAKYHDKKTMGLGEVRPCIGCAECISAFNISKVIYSTEKGYEVFK